MAVWEGVVWGWCPTRKIQLVSDQLSSINVSVLVSGKRTEGNRHIRSGEKNSGKKCGGIREKKQNQGTIFIQSGLWWQL